MRLSSMFLAGFFCSLASAAGPLPRPTTQQAQWQDMEVGLFIHFTMATYAPDWNWRTFKDLPSPRVFNPEKLDTDQWVEAARAIGARYAVLTAKHGDGFCLWPTDAYPYSVRQSPWRDGKGDIIEDFVRSCRKAGIKPGIYYSTTANAYLHVDGPGRVQTGKPDEQARYKAICEQQLTELWTRYGELAEIWFDGGVLPPREGGPDMEALLKRHQPNAMVFQSARATIRWVGNENGVADDPCWCTTIGPDRPGQGDPEGRCWLPAECDVPLRGSEWMWRPGQEKSIRTLGNLMGLYYNSVGHNANLLLNSTPDRSGLIPEPDMQRYREFGQEIARRFGRSVAETSGKGNEVVLELPRATSIDHAIVMEQIGEGQRIRQYVLEGKSAGQWVELSKGTAVGHKKIDRFGPLEVEAVRLKITRSVAEPLVRSLAVYSVQQPPAPLGDWRWALDDVEQDRTAEAAGGPAGVVHGAQLGGGIVGRALRFDGERSFVSLGDMEVGRRDFTIAAWIRPEGGIDGERVILARERGGVAANQMRLSVLPGGKLSFSFGDEAGNGTWPLASGEGAIASDRWTYVAAVREGRKVTLYVNGSPVATKTTDKVLTHLAEGLEMRLGARYPAEGDGAINVFRGRIDQLRICGKALGTADLAPPAELLQRAAVAPLDSTTAPVIIQRP